ncbi:unnamed protein product [Lactuca virosa]|uniref:Uncharacterized protein n=1 Tax=Lactuca virosa TaxID=75947 RepID=A0AAU9N1N7_9ASTR|nr:unnamed protein product [Lactuca virosa]
MAQSYTIYVLYQRKVNMEVLAPESFKLKLKCRCDGLCSSCKQTCKMDVNFKEDPVPGSVGEILINVSLKTTAAGCWNIRFNKIINEKEAIDKPYVDPEYWKDVGFKPYYVPEEPDEVFLVEEGEEIEESWITGLHLYFF